MSTTAVALPALPVQATGEVRSKLAWTVSDALTIAKRNLISMTRTPQVLVFSTIQPVIFVLMFRYVFGGSIHIPGVRYVDYLMAGIFVQTVTFGSINTGVGLAEDLQKGLIERFRSLADGPLRGTRRPHVGRHAAQPVRHHPHGARRFPRRIPPAHQRPRTAWSGRRAAPVRFAMSWVMALIGLVTKNAEAAQAAAFPLMALLVFASNAFVSTSDHAGAAAGLRQPSARLGHRERRPGPAPRRPDLVEGPGRGGVGGRHRRRVRPLRRPALPQGGLKARLTAATRPS